MISLSVIIPTIGRDSLATLLAGLVLQLEEQDEVIVVSDGPLVPMRRAAWPVDPRIKYVEGEKTCRWGNAQRNAGIQAAKGTHLLFLDDDDEVLPEYLKTGRSAALESPDRIILFKTRHHGGTIWKLPEVREANVSTQMFLIPNVPGRLGLWSDRYEGDLDFLKSTIALYPKPQDEVIWRQETLTIHREPPDNSPFVKWPTLSLIIPSIGRPLLKRLLDQVLPQLWEDDEILVVGDGPQPSAQAMAEGLDPRIRYYEYGPTRCWGHQQRNWAMLVADKTHIMFLDDDDESRPGAFNVIREVAARHPDKLLIFKTLHQGSPIWKEPEIRVTNVSTQCFVVPNIPERFGTWGSRYAGDFDFIESSVKAHPLGKDGVIFRPEITSVHGEPNRA
jgi:glycosyltransferase involved in cell wall biosynthesis